MDARRVHIDGSAGRRLKGTNFVRLEARLFDGSGDNGVQMLLLQAPRQVVSPSFAFASPFFAIALKVFDWKGGSAEPSAIPSSDGGSFFGKQHPMALERQKDLWIWFNQILTNFWI
jgi:hypothetical protein